MSTEKTPAQIRLPKPSGMPDPLPSDLVGDFARSGYRVEISGADLLVTRTGTLDIDDVGAFPAPIDDPIDGQEAKNLSAIVVAWQAEQAA